ncbi:peptidoglycan recognition protein-like [Mytilus californianus]|uniref:peptidoglycan recognition protein-like n=1 Tax=Mytilus californianus TaxID=6549 RepID=UPI00224510FC|nr:peptidoglycan recognition protein-like [Mytilus californianus]
MKAVSLVLCFAFLILQVDSLNSDQACLEIKGQCQDDNNKCPGSYYSGKCSGGETRRCCTQTAVEKDAGYCSNLQIVSRDSWGARRPVKVSNIPNPVPYFFIHHTAGRECHSFVQCTNLMKEIQNYHMDDPHRQYYDIGYSFLVGQDGRLYEGRGFRREGAHTKHYNTVGLATSFIGNFMDHLPNNQSQAEVKALIQCGVYNNYISKNYRLYGHRDIGTTASPGTAFYNVVQSWPRYSAQKPLEDKIF